MTIEERILKKLENAFVLQNTFGRTVDELPFIAKGLLNIVPEGHREFIPDAIDVHIRNSQNFPTPADILQILGCVNKFDTTYYRRLLEKQRGGYISFSEQEYLRDYEKNARKMNGIHPDIKAAHLQIGGQSPTLVIENSSETDVVESDQAEPLFELFWHYCPKKINKPETKTIFMSIINGTHPQAEKTLPEEIVEGMQYFKTAMRGTEDQYIKTPSSWLNESGWLNEHKGTQKVKWGWWRRFRSDYWIQESMKKRIDIHVEHLKLCDVKWDWLNFGPPPGHPEFFLFSAMTIAEKDLDYVPNDYVYVETIIEKYKPENRFESQAQNLINRFGLLAEGEKLEIDEFEVCSRHSLNDEIRKNELLPWQKLKKDNGSQKISENAIEAEAQGKMASYFDR